MNGKPLPLKHGYPLRLMIPVKYGIKSLKRIGTLFFSNTPPPDYWYERGYDYYSGLKKKRENQIISSFSINSKSNQSKFPVEYLRV